MARLVGVFIFVLLVVSGCSTGGPWICSDYGSTTSCAGGRYIIPSLGISSHQGIDFAGAAGAEVISATHRIVTNKSYDPCSGHSITVETDIVARERDLPILLYAKYVHAQAIPTLGLGQKLKPGDLIGTVIRFSARSDALRTGTRVRFTASVLSRSSREFFVAALLA